MDRERFVLIERPNTGVAKLVLNNPPLNLVTLEMSRQLIEASNELERDDSIRAVVVSGAGQKAFCAGANINEFLAVRDRVVEAKLSQENEAFGALEFLSKPVIAAIGGIALGGGCEIALACDIRVMAADAKIGLPEVKLGVLPGSGGLYRLPKLVGAARAAELMYLGDPIDAHQAEGIGLVNHVLPTREEATEYALALATEIARRPMEAVAAIKRGVRESPTLPYQEAVQLTLDLSEEVFKTDNVTEGVTAFFEKRAPRFNAGVADGPRDGAEKEVSSVGNLSADRRA